MNGGERESGIVGAGPTENAGSYYFSAVASPSPSSATYDNVIAGCKSEQDREEGTTERSSSRREPVVDDLHRRVVTTTTTEMTR
jgi:hypothetical protein